MDPNSGASLVNFVRPRALEHEVCAPVGFEARCDRTGGLGHRLSTIGRELTRVYFRVGCDPTRFGARCDEAARGMTLDPVLHV